MQMFLVMQYRAEAKCDERFELQGLFSTCALAEDACHGDSYSIVPFTVDAEYPEENVGVHEGWYPATEPRPEWAV